MNEIETPVFESQNTGPTDSEIAAGWGPYRGPAPLDADPRSTGLNEPTQEEIDRMTLITSTNPTLQFMNNANEQTGFFENILNQTGETIGNAIVNTVSAGSTAANTAINNLAPAQQPTTTPVVASPVMSGQMMGLLAVGALVVYYVVKNQK
jgi:hypothetical protein